MVYIWVGDPSREGGSPGSPGRSVLQGGSEHVRQGGGGRIGRTIGRGTDRARRLCRAIGMTSGAHRTGECPSDFAAARRVLELAGCARWERHFDNPRFMRAPIRVAIGRQHDAQPSLKNLRQDACRGRPRCFGRFARSLGRRFIDHRGRRAIAFRRAAREAPLDVAAEHRAAAGGDNEGSERRNTQRSVGMSVEPAHHWPPLFGVRPRKRRISLAGR